MGGAYFKFWPIGGALIREGALIRRFTVVTCFTCNVSGVIVKRVRKKNGSKN